MDSLHWPLTVLSKAVHFKNLTGASMHVGLSQPQLSRLISQIEKEFDVVLLDRSAKRKSGWTPTAYKLAEIYAQNSRKLRSSVHELLAEQVPSHINIGLLEGLREEALKIAHSIFQKSKVQEIEMDVYDQNELEEKFINGNLEIILTMREPGKQKYKNILEVGYQSLENINKNQNFSVLSAFEYGRLKKKPASKILISNSLTVRKNWLDLYGGHGTLPSLVKGSRGKDLFPVYVIATDTLSDSVWKIISESVKNQRL